MLVALILGLAGGCSTTKQTPDDQPTADAKPAETTSGPTFGDDPMGAARRWADSPPSDTREAMRRRVASWSDRVVLRVYRAGEDEYRAVVAESDAKHAEAVLLTLVPTDGGWQVDTVEETDATRAWPTN